MEKLYTTLSNALAELFGLILIITLIVLGLVVALVFYVLALLYKCFDFLLLIWGIHLIWHYVIN